MKYIFISAFILFFFISCSEDAPDAPSQTIDASITGMWQVKSSQTITTIRPRPEQKPDTLIYNGGAGEPASYMFGAKENIIEIRGDNKIKVFYINSRGGITITDEYVRYEVRGDTLIRRGATLDIYHRYYREEGALVVERLPREDNGWNYAVSRYFKIE